MRKKPIILSLQIVSKKGVSEGSFRIEHHPSHDLFVKKHLILSGVIKKIQ